jgi:hypothetical protein
MSLLDWRLELHAQLTDHDFIQDPDDIPGGCLSCWQTVERGIPESPISGGES